MDLFCNENDHDDQAKYGRYITKQHIQFLLYCYVTKGLNPHERKTFFSVPVIFSSRKNPIRITMENHHQIPVNPIKYP